MTSPADREVAENAVTCSFAIPLKDPAGFGKLECHTMIHDKLLPPAVRSGLSNTPGALEAFLKLSKSHQHEYLKWILEAKKAETQNRRIQKAVGMLLEAKDS
jgi:uncharacterized protein YdeI (YjbR/CyaY-like superfamily)